jgi:hypothetical protein
MEIEQLRKRLADCEMKNARVAHDVRAFDYPFGCANIPCPFQLNKEISELEALIESKVGGTRVRYENADMTADLS